MTRRAARTELEAFGRQGEQYVAEELRRRGYTVVLIGESSDYDLLVEGVARAEVKSALPSGRYDRANGAGFQFSLRRRGHLVDEELLFLLCYSSLEAEPVVFVIPGEHVGRALTKITITSLDPNKYRGQWGAYREAWEWVQRAITALGSRQLELFRTIEEAVIPF